MYAPPIVVSPEGFTLSQTPAICQYLGKMFGFYPSTAEGEARCAQISMSVADLHSEGRQCFHPKDYFASYFNQVEEAKVAVAVFEKGRMLKWLNHFEHLLAFNNGGAAYFVEDKLTYADLGVFHILNALQAQFPEAFTGANIPLLKAFQQRIASFPPIDAYYKSDRVKPWEGNSCN